MVKINQLDRATLKIIAADVEKALSTVAQKHGVSLIYRGARFSAFEADMKIRLEVSSAKAQENLAARLTLYGIKSLDFTFKGAAYVVSGINRKAHAKPIQVTRKSDGKKYVMSVDVLRQLQGLVSDDDKIMAAEAAMR